MKGKVCIAPKPKEAWSLSYMKDLVDTIHWFRGTHAENPRAKLLADKAQPSGDQDIIDIVLYLQDDETIDKDIFVYSEINDVHWSWHIFPTRIGFTVFQNVSLIEEPEDTAS